MSMTIDEMIAVLQAAKRGEQVQSRPKYKTDDLWFTCYEPAWNFADFDFRVKPKPREWWVNFYPIEGPRPSICESKNTANMIAHLSRLECVHVREVLEGEQ